MLDIDRKILTMDKVICRHLAEADYSNRGMIAQDILSYLRNLVKHLMLKCYAGSNDIDNTYGIYKYNQMNPDSVKRGREVLDSFIANHGSTPISYVLSCILLPRLFYKRDISLF